MEQRRNQVQTQLIERATGDQAFRRELLANPKGTLEREYGVQIPADREITVVEDTQTTAHLVLPPAPAAAQAELSDRELEAVAGGSGGSSGDIWCILDPRTCSGPGC